MLLISLSLDHSRPRIRVLRLFLAKRNVSRCCFIVELSPTEFASHSRIKSSRHLLIRSTVLKLLKSFNSSVLVNSCCFHSLSELQALSFPLSHSSRHLLLFLVAHAFLLSLALHHRLFLLTVNYSLRLSIKSLPFLLEHLFTDFTMF